MPKQLANPDYTPPEGYYDTSSLQMDEMLYARHAEIKNLEDLSVQRGTPIPTLYAVFYKFIQNPSAISVETFKRMVDTDDTIGPGVDFLTTCLAARIGAYKHPSEEITAFINKALNKIEGGWVNKVKEILSASWAGYYVGEKVWANTADGFIIERVAPLPPTSVLFEVDRAGRLTVDGILQYQRNWNPYSLGSGINFFGGVAGGGAGSGFNSNNGWLSPDPYARFGDLPFPLRTANQFNYLSIRIPRQKCVHYAFDAQGKFDNPYGRSMLRRAYKWWVLKDAIMRMYATAMDRKGTPLTIVWADPNTTILNPAKATPGKARGKNVGINAAEAAAAAFANIHNDTVITLPGKKGQIFDVEALDQTWSPELFTGGIDLCNKSLLRSLLIPGLIFSSGDGSGSFALGSEHGRTFDKILDGINAGVTQVLLEQVVRDLLAYNYPQSYWEREGLGEFTQRELTSEERQKEMEVVEKGVNVGAIDMNDLSDLNEVRKKAGFSTRTETIPQYGLVDEDGNKQPGPQPIEGEDGEASGDDSGDGVGGKDTDGAKKGQREVDAAGGAPGGGRDSSRGRKA